MSPYREPSPPPSDPPPPLLARVWGWKHTPAVLLAAILLSELTALIASASTVMGPAVGLVGAIAVMGWLAEAARERYR